MASRRILAINGSYRDGGITDQTVEQILAGTREQGATVEHVRLRDYPIGFCRNCRVCMQQPGDTPGRCVLNDRMSELIRKIEEADGYVLAAPTNFSAVTALFKRFMERLSPYGYWPCGQAAPKFRKAKSRNKPTVIISSCAAPGLLGRLTYGTNQTLRVAAKTIGGRIVGSMVTGLISQERKQALPRRARRRAAVLATRLAA
jgi:multimeric flavodoxin WrbA